MRREHLTDRFWTRHANPRSVWTLVVTYPLLVVAVYRRDSRLLLACLAFAAVNLFGHPEPAADDAWATRVVRGERQWLDRGLASSPVDLLFVACATPVYVLTVRSALERRPVRTAVWTAASLLVMLLFFHRMTRLYDAEA